MPKNRIRNLISKNQHICGLLLAVVLVFSACAPRVQYQEGLSQFRPKIRTLQKKILANPQDAQAIADLGVIYFAVEDYRRAEGYLRNAFEKQPDDPRIAFYTGLAYEFRGKDEIAIAIHSRYRNYPESSPFRKMMAGRYQRLFLSKLRRDIDSLVVLEKELSKDRIVRSAVAVFPFKYAGIDTQYAHLGYGLSEMISIDLAKVSVLRVLERVRLQALSEELEFAQTSLVEQATAPRTGLLLGAGKVISGALDVREQKELHVDVIASDVRQDYAARTASKSDALNQFYRLEKSIVFGILDQMGIELTQEEQEEILRVPTRNLQAFLMFCRGLQQESNGLYIAAFRSFQQATQIDPAFQTAAEKLEITNAASEMRSRREDVLAATMRRERFLRASKEALVEARLRHLGENIGAAILLGIDKRKTVEEASSAGLEDLPEPPPPPVRESVTSGRK
ncbi:MAG: hypothetical protein H6695_11665 [Deferribacteres bacterium]|nr:hypothetical protein [candidate division KSB1 bacterium]MCB9510836.1 hypothetical protein [Deferribacteres bacterium]